MEAEQQTQEAPKEDEVTYEENIQQEQETEPEECVASEATTEQKREEARQKNLGLNDQWDDRSSFIHGLSVGLGIGCIATFVMMWISIFFTPLMPPAVTYENMLSIFIYPLIYLLAVGLIALTAGIVREYYVKRKF